MTDEEVLRAFFAGLALQGLLAGKTASIGAAPRVAVDLADELLDELYADKDDAGLAAIYKEKRR